ncbi:immunoglobulin domain-containing protein [Emticicia agri]|uniref:Ig-like domain-containing protein n=1 Tax=Emticicia agri TaxID=2492393 RepID=A0A4Q5M059_9BACT|nr:3-coathanger stack domain-containing protein [Emticicia agri]RYU95538.1 hypothetical protein EWM59_11630 [Emticicia agri]
MDNGNIQFINDGLSLDNINTGRFDDANRISITTAEDNSDILNIFWTVGFGANSYVRRFNTATNTVLWDSPLRIATTSINPNATQSGIFALGNYVIWSDARHRDISNNYQNYEIYAQRILPDKTVAWGLNGKRITDIISSEFSPRMVKSSSGIYLCWNGNNGASHRIMKIDSNGIMLWGNTGILVENNVSNSEFTPTLYENNDTLTTFYTRQYNTGVERFWGQKLTPEGRKLWGSNGQYVSHTSNYNVSLEEYPDVLKAPDGYIIGFNQGYTTRVLKANPCNNPPQPPSVNNPKLCFSGASAKLKATNCDGIVQWYANDRITLLHSDSTFTVSNISQPVSYFAACVSNTGCASLNLAESKITIPQSSANITTTYTNNNTPVEVATINTLIASNLIEPSARVNYISKNIQLNTGFQAKQGSVFIAIAQNCTND